MREKIDEYVAKTFGSRVPAENVSHLLFLITKLPKLPLFGYCCGEGRVCADRRLVKDHLVQELGQVEIDPLHGALSRHDERSRYRLRQRNHKGGPPGQFADICGCDTRIERYETQVADALARVKVSHQPSLKKKKNSFSLPLRLRASRAFLLKFPPRNAWSEDFPFRWFVFLATSLFSRKRREKEERKKKKVKTPQTTLVSRRYFSLRFKQQKRCHLYNTNIISYHIMKNFHCI